MKRVTILGATGSVGRNTVDLIARAPDSFAVEALTANRDAARLAEQAKALGAKFAAVADPSAYGDLKAALSGTGIEAAAGPDAVVEAAGRPSDWVMAAIVGAAGLVPTLAAIRQGNVAEVTAATTKLRHDFFYIKNLSFSLDTFIAAKTVWAMLTGAGSK